MRLIDDRVAKAWPYIAAAPSNLPVSLTEAKGYLRVDGTDDDALITTMIKAATEFGERYTRLFFVQRSVVTYRDSFSNSLELRRGPLASVTSVERMVAGVLTAVSTGVYFATVSNSFSSLSLKTGQQWPTDEDDQEQAIKITFVAGMAVDEADPSVPDDIKTAILAHVAKLYENRGDCADDNTADKWIQDLLPATSKMLYDARRVRDIWRGA